MPPDYTLILLNGKRRHRSGVITGPSHGPDVASIPALAIERLEFLRDGASAQYGSDAIAGVLNFITRSDSEGITAELETGQYYAGDGQANKFSGIAGFSLNQSGFLNISLEYGNQDFTSRSIQRPDAAALEAVGAPGILNPAQLWGQPKVDDELKLFVNAAVDVNESVELYGFGNFSERDVELEFNWRNPNRQFGIFTAGPERLVLDLTPDGTGNCPQAGTPNAIPAPPEFPTQAEYDADVLAVQSVAADPNCWVVNEVYPAGYKPFYGANITDASAVLGVRGESDSGLLWDVSFAYGSNGADYTLRDTINASLGPESPTTFNPGETIQADTNFNIDIVMPVDVTAFYSALNVAAGFEWREETFETVAGDQASWIPGPFFAQDTSIGANGFPGYSPDQAGKWDRSNIALYLDLEADLTEKFTLGLAGRYEDFEDFGSTSNYKVSLRYRFNDVFSLRGAASTGFKAPTPGLSNQTKLSTVGIQGELFQVGRIPPTNSVAVFYGGKPLESEDTENLSLGITIDPFDKLAITADYFRIDVENGISLGGVPITDEDRQELIDQGVPGATDFAFIQFYGNDITAEIRGWDLVASYAVDWETAGRTDFSLAFNDTQSDIAIAGITGDRRGIIDEEYDVRYRGIFTVTHWWNDLRLQLRASYYDEWARADLPTGPPHPVCSDERPVPLGADACYSDTWLFDIEAAYTFRDRFTVAVGADNVFDEYPDTDFLYPDFSSGRIYPDSSPFGFNGGFWYVRLRAEF
jgi:iron complex outermembrane receptor protein